VKSRTTVLTCLEQFVNADNAVSESCDQEMLYRLQHVTVEWRCDTGISLEEKTGINTGLKVKVKVKLSLCLTKHHVMKTHWGI
jgi:hypothetical protein